MDLSPFLLSSKCSTSPSYSKQQLERRWPSKLQPFLGYWVNGQGSQHISAWCWQEPCARSGPEPGCWGKQTKLMNPWATWRINLKKCNEICSKLSPVAPLVVVPRHKLHERWAQSNTSLGIKDAWPDIQRQRYDFSYLFPHTRPIWLRLDSSNHLESPTKSLETTSSSV